MAFLCTILAGVVCFVFGYVMGVICACVGHREKKAAGRKAEPPFETSEDVMRREG